MHIFTFMASAQWGGAEKTFVDLSNELSKKHIITALLLRKTNYRQRFHKNVRVIETTSHPTRNNPLLLYEMYKVIRQQRPDLVHTHGAKAALLIHRLSSFLKINHLATKHNARTGRIFNRLPFVSTVSQEAHDSVSANDCRQIRVIPNGVNPQAIEAHLRKDIFGIAAIGRLDRIKGFDILLEQLKNISFPYHLTIAGEGPEKKRLSAKIMELQLEQNVSMIGFCEHVPELIRKSHAVVIASHSEGFPQVMVEALFYGNVLISTKVGGAVELLPQMFLTDQRNLGAKLEHLYENYEEYRNNFNLLHQRRAKEYTLPVITAQYEAYYEAIMSR